MNKQLRSLLALAGKIENKQGRAMDNKCGLMGAVFLGFATTPPDNPNQPKPSVSKFESIWKSGVPITTGYCLFKTVKPKRKLIHEEKEISNWSKVKSHTGFWTKVNDNLRAKVDSWIRNHHHVVHSPLSRSSLLVLFKG